VTARPWRAAAYTRDPWGRRVPTGRVAGRTWPGIRRWVRAHQAAGDTVQVWEILPLPSGVLVHWARDLEVLGD
jgi:hypothetical protein